MTDLQKKITGIVILVMIAALSVMTLVMPKKEYSENENRYLADFPALSWQSIANTSFMDGLESYLSDHFAGRDPFMTVRTCYERITWRNQVNGIYMCDDGYYIEEYPAPKNNERVAGALKRLAEGVENAGIHAMLVPTAVTVYADKLPAASRNASETEEIASIRRLLDEATEQAGKIDFVDVTGILEAHRDEEQLYYRLDHHWTTAGAYYAYRELCPHLGLEPLARDSFREEQVSDSFRGSFFSKVNDMTVAPDSIVAFRSDRLRLTVEYPDDKLVTDTLYADEYLDKKDKYSFFLNNQHPYVEITNEAAETDRAIALVKDSYANCFVPFLAEHFSKIYVFDTRYYRDKVTEFINSHSEITDVLFLYNMHTIDTDGGVSGIR